MKQDTLRNTLINLLTTQPMGLSLSALIADVIAADARFNHWIGTYGKKVLEETTLMERLDMYEDIVAHCSKAAVEFSLARDPTPLELVLKNALDRLRQDIP